MYHFVLPMLTFILFILIQSYVSHLTYLTTAWPWKIFPHPARVSLLCDTDRFCCALVHLLWSCIIPVTSAQMLFSSALLWGGQVTTSALFHDDIQTTLLLQYTLCNAYYTSERAGTAHCHSGNAHRSASPLLQFDLSASVSYLAACLPDMHCLFFSLYRPAVCFLHYLFKITRCWLIPVPSPLCFCPSLGWEEPSVDHKRLAPAGKYIHFCEKMTSEIFPVPSLV